MDSKKILGLDLGTNSIGWSLVEINREENQGRILGMGVRIFPEGVENLNQGEKEISKNAARNVNRSARRQIQRRKRRKTDLLKILIQYDMAPQGDFKDQAYWLSPEFLKWVALNPYELRHRAITEKIALKELGRVFYHLAQHRGFQSNARNVSDNDDSTIYKGGNGMTGIDTTASLIENETLGSALYQKLFPAPGQPFKYFPERIRRRYTTRKMYIDEFEKIWEEQSRFHPELTQQLNEEIGGRRREGYKRDGVLFFQRPLRSQKSKIGKCTFHPNKSRRAISAPDFEEFRIWQFINSIRCNGESLVDADRQLVYNLLVSQDRVKFDKLRKHLGKASAAYSFNFDDETSCPNAPTLRFLSSRGIFSQSWFGFKKSKQEEIWHDLYFYDDKELLRKRAQERWGLSEDAATKFGDYSLKQGFASLSRRAIQNILPFLALGHDYDVAVTLGGIKNALGDQNIVDIFDTDFRIAVEEIVRTNPRGGYINHLKAWLKDNYGFEDKRLEKLYHHSADVNERKLLNRLPYGMEADRQIQQLRNPIVIQALFELRKVINELLERFGPFDEIKIELGRDLKNPKNRRLEIQRQNKRQQQYHEKVIDRLRELGIDETYDNVLKYKLWEECNATCPYTGRPIAVNQLFSNQIQIEHIIPYSRSLDDSFMNKTLCFSDENARKGDRTPYEYYHGVLGSEKWVDVKQRALSLFKNSRDFPNRYKKFERFVLTSTQDLEGFISRQLNDTRYISREAAEYLRQICPKVWVASGQLTARLRHLWGLNSIIDDKSNQKDRSDHRHHAIDALVVAVHTHRDLQLMSRLNRHGISPDSLADSFPFPWPGFRSDAETYVSNILASHKTNHRVVSTRLAITRSKGKVFRNKSSAARGALHKETVYGKRKRLDGSYKYHVRKSLEDIKEKAQVDKIVDQKIKDLVRNRLRELGVDITMKKYKVPPGAFFSKDENGQILPLIWLPNNRGGKVPVYSVRIAEELGNAAQLKSSQNQYVNPRNNHHVLIYKSKNGILKEDLISFWVAAERIRQKSPVYQIPADCEEIIAILRKNDMFLIGWDISIPENSTEILSRHLYRVDNLSSLDYVFKHHLTDNDEEKVRIQSFKKWQELNPIKVRISSTGKVIGLV